MDLKDALALGNLGALAAVVIVYLLLENKKKPKNGNGKTSGDLDPAVWELKLHSILADELQPIGDKLERIAATLHKVRNSLLILRGKTEHDDE